MWRIALTYVGALAGAGFASGRELVTFFVAFGPKGFWGIALATGLFAISGLVLLQACNRLNCDSYQQLFAIIFPGKWCKAAEGLLSLALWLGLAIMLVGCGTLLTQLTGLPKAVGFAAAAILVYWSLYRGGEGFLVINGYLMLVLVVLAVLICLQFLSRPLTCLQPITTAMLLPNWGIAAVLYWMYNMLLAMAGLIGVRRKRHAGRSVTAGALLLGGFALLLALCLFLLPEAQRQAQMPILVMAESMGHGYGLIYAVVILLAMYTTALANCYGLTINYTAQIKNRKKLLLIILLPTAIWIGFDFATLVGIIYPLLGYCSIPVMAGMILKTLTMLLGGRK